jgi:uncharacterized protein YigA (DUF484 family)
VYTSFVDIAREKDIEQLRKAALLLANENQWLVTKVAELTKQLLKAQGKDAEALQLQIGELEQRLAARNKMLFGQSSEKRSRAGKPKGADKPPQKGHGRTTRARCGRPRVHVMRRWSGRVAWQARRVGRD